MSRLIGMGVSVMQEEMNYFLRKVEVDTYRRVLTKDLAGVSRNVGSRWAMIAAA